MWELYKYNALDLTPTVFPLKQNQLSGWQSLLCTHSCRKLISSLMKARQKKSVVTRITRICNPRKTHLMNTTAHLTLHFYVNS